MTTKTYTAEFGIYQNCHIVATEEKTFTAANETEAKAKAEQIGQAIEAETLEQEIKVLTKDGCENPAEATSDWWACLEGLYEE